MPPTAPDEPLFLPPLRNAVASEPAVSKNGPPPAPKASSDPDWQGINIHHLLVTSVRDYAIFVLDRQGYIATWNAGAQQIKGYSAGEAIGHHFSIFYPPEDLAWNKPAYELDVAAQEGRFEDEGWRMRKDGSRFWANVVITVLRNEAQELIGYAKITRDLTERHNATEQAINDARRIAAEEAARAAAEARVDELAELAAQLEHQTREAAAANIELEYQVEEAQALSEELEQTNAQLQDAVLEAQEARQAAEDANRAKGDFLAAISHELRTPLNAIGGYADLLTMGLRGVLNDEQLLDIERIRRSQQHLLGIINDILNFSRIEAGHLTYDIAPVPISEMLDGISMFITLQAKTKGLQYAQALCPQSAVVQADRTKLEQILLNLLSNAVKFTPSGGHITLTCEIDTDSVLLHIRDSGIGIEADKFDAIFEPFVQVGRSLTHASEGTGLGLAISRELARKMGGDITVESQTGVGSVFTLRLPRLPDRMES